MKTTVRVMRSYDYCHFEVSLEGDFPPETMLDDTNNLRKQAALLVDEAVRQYKVAKKAEGKRDSREWEINSTLQKVDLIKAIPPSEWTVEQAALMRAYEDKTFWKQYESDNYFYDDDPDREHHFSMLRRFQAVVVKAG